MERTFCPHDQHEAIPAWSVSPVLMINMRQFQHEAEPLLFTMYPNACRFQPSFNPIREVGRNSNPP